MIKKEPAEHLDLKAAKKAEKKKLEERTTA